LTPYIGISNFESPLNLIILEIDTIFSDGKAQVVYCSLFGLLDEKYVTVGTVVLKRRQGIPLEQASQADGIIVDLIPQKMESYGQALLLKRVRSEYDQEFLFVADGDHKVNFQNNALFITGLSPKSKYCTKI